VQEEQDVRARDRRSGIELTGTAWLGVEQPGVHARVEQQGQAGIRPAVHDDQLDLASGGDVSQQGRESVII
jgi:hypothetical protein